MAHWCVLNNITLKNRSIVIYSALLPIPNVENMKFKDKFKTKDQWFDQFKSTDATLEDVIPAYMQSTSSFLHSRSILRYHSYTISFYLNLNNIVSPRTWITIGIYREVICQIDQNTFRSDESFLKICGFSSVKISNL